MIDYTKLAAVDFLPAEIEDFEERAAILEHDAGYSKEEAEKRAYMMIASGKDKQKQPSPEVMKRRIEEVTKNIFRFDRKIDDNQQNKH